MAVVAEFNRGLTEGRMKRQRQQEELNAECRVQNAELKFTLTYIMPSPVGSEAARAE